MQKIVYLLSKKRLLWQFRLLIAVCIPIMLAAAGCEKKRAFVLPEEDAAQVSGLSSLPADSVEQTATQSVREEAAPESVLLVHVCGAVVSEGVYTLQEGARVIDAVTAAGGFTDDADRHIVNQASLISDGMRLYIPVTGETQLFAGTEDATAFDVQTQDTRININTASAQELCTLNGIGPGRAADIVRYREEHGPFRSIEEIMNVSGIKDRTFATIREYIRV
ncbi:MAG: helix-hairpin-helix domain-containing protein [Lachnospiraceae bacterium]|nr:helix-hairpin-helix domain-containing protein [Lachnospiraceae bacterium]